jgi:uncharacterized membrane protein
MEDRPEVLLVGESWLSTGTHVKGFNSFFTGFYEEGHAALTAALGQAFDVVHVPSHKASTDFPDRAEDLARYAAILFSDVGSDTLLLHPKTFLQMEVRPNRLLAVKEYVEGGGGFGMIGGYMSFAGISGQAHYHRTPIEEILPVWVFPHDDRTEVPQGVIPQARAPSHPVLARAGGTWPPLLGYNALTLKDDAALLLEFNGDPILSVRNVGAGRTLAFASDCAPHWGSPQFVAWEHYSDFWIDAVRWLAGHH